MPLYAVDEAAQRLNITKTALRGRIRRHSVAAHKGVDGAWLVEVPEDATPHVTPHTPRGTTQPTPTPPANPAKDMLLGALMSEVDFLRAQLERETTAHTQAVHELHMILADTRRALSASAMPPAASQSDETAREAESSLSPPLPSQRGTPRTSGARFRQWLYKG